MEVIPVEVKEFAVAQPQLQPGKRPDAQDIIKVDGKWIQVSSGSSDQQAVRVLETGECMDIDFRDYAGVRYSCDPRNSTRDKICVQKMDETSHTTQMKPSVKDLLGKFTDNEARNIWWGPEQKDRPNLINEVTVWGELVSRRK